MPSQSEPATILVIDSRELRRAGVIGLMTGWAEKNAVELVALTPEAALGTFGGDLVYRLIILSLGAQSISDRSILQLIKVTRALAPTSPVVVMSDRDEASEVVASLGAGVQGFLPSSMGRDLALQAFSFIIAGGSYFPPSAIREAPQQSRARGGSPGDDGPKTNGERKAAAHFGTLDQGETEPDIDQDGEPDGEPNEATHHHLMTNRQQEVLDLLKEGQPNKMIARRLGMTEATVKVHVRQIMRKLGATNRTQAALCAQHYCGNGSHDALDDVAQPISLKNGVRGHRVPS